MQIEKLSKELKAIRKIKSDEYGPFNKKMQAIADVWSVLIGKKLRPHQVALMYAMAKIIRANNEYKYDSYRCNQLLGPSGRDTEKMSRVGR